MERVVWIPQKRRGYRAAHYNLDLLRRVGAQVTPTGRTWGSCTSETCNCTSHSPLLAEYHVVLADEATVVFKEHGDGSFHHHRYVTVAHEVTL